MYLYTLINILVDISNKILFSIFKLLHIYIKFKKIAFLYFSILFDEDVG
jgi:hypothetical protein